MDNEQVKNATPRKEGRRCVWNPKERSSGHDSLGRKCHSAGNLTCRATLEDLEPSDHDRPRLHRDRDDIGTLLVGCQRHGVLCPCALRVVRGPLWFTNNHVEVSVCVLRVDLPDIRLAVVLRKFIRGPRHVVLTSFADNPSVGVSPSDEEVRSGLPIDWLVTHDDEVLASERSWAVVGHPTFIDDADFVEEVIHVLRSLLNRHCGLHLSYTVEI